MTFDDDDLRTAATMGYAALLPGMQKMLDMMQAQMDAMRARLAELQSGDSPAKKRRGKANRGWSEDPVERKREMKRRRKITAKKMGKKLHPSDPKSPDHAKWAKSVGKASRNHWASMTVKERKQRLAKMRAGRDAKRIPEVRLELAS